MVWLAHATLPHLCNASQSFARVKVICQHVEHTSSQHRGALSADAKTTWGFEVTAALVSRVQESLETGTLPVPLSCRGTHPTQDLRTRAALATWVGVNEWSDIHAELFVLCLVRPMVKPAVCRRLSREARLMQRCAAERSPRRVLRHRCFVSMIAWNQLLLGQYRPGSSSRSVSHGASQSRSLPLTIHPIPPSLGEGQGVSYLKYVYILTKINVVGRYVILIVG